MPKRIATAILLLLLIVAYAIAQLYFSARSSAAATEWAERVTQSAPVKPAVEYRRGLWTSTQLITFDAKPSRMTVKNVIHHGPFPAFAGVGAATIDHSIEWEGEAGKAARDAFGGKPPLSGRTVLKLAGGGVTELAGAPAKLGTPGEEFTWDGFSGRIEFTPGFASYRATLAAPGLAANGKTGAATVKALTLEADQQRMAGTETIYLGAVTLKAAGITFVKDGKTVFQVKDAAMSSNQQSADNQFLDVLLSLKAAAFTAGGVDGTDLEYSFGLRHFNGVSLDQFTRALREAGRVQPAIARGAPAGPELAAIQAALMTHGGALLKGNPVVTVDRVGFKSQGGELRLTGRAAVSGVTDADLAQPMGLLAKLDAQVDFAVSEPLARQLYTASRTRGMQQQLGELTPAQVKEAEAAALKELDARLAEMGGQGYLTTGEGRIAAKIQFKEGALTVNGKPFGPGGPPAAPPPAR